MRWFIYILIVVNLVVALWIYQSQGWQLRSTVLQYPQVGEIRVVNNAQAPLSNCYRAGPYETSAIAEGIAVAIRRDGVESIVSEEAANASIMYQVILPQKAKASVATMRKLEKAGISDAWIIPDGDYKNGISLGLFRERNNAVLRRIEIESLGYSVRIIERSPQNNAYWVNLKSIDQRETDSNILNKLGILSQGKRFMPFSCEKIVPIN